MLDQRSNFFEGLPWRQWPDLFLVLWDLNISLSEISFSLEECSMLAGLEHNSDNLQANIVNVFKPAENLDAVIHPNFSHSYKFYLHFNQVNNCSA